MLLTQFFQPQTQKNNKNLSEKRPQKVRKSAAKIRKNPQTYANPDFCTEQDSGFGANSRILKDYLQSVHTLLADLGLKSFANRCK